MNAHAQNDPSPMCLAALEYARRNKPVFPCGHDKAPMVGGGFKAASTDEAQIRKWWAMWPWAMIGMPTGRASGITAIDCDTKNGLDGRESLRALAAPHGGLPDTIEILTPSGGCHLWFETPDAEIRNSASKIAPGVDVRGEGGYIIVPPSAVLGGKRYELEASSPATPAPMPQWLVARCQQPERLAEPPGGQSNGQTGGDGVWQGSRSDYLARYAGRLAYAGLNADQILAATLAENQRACRPPLSEAEIRSTVAKSASAWVHRAQVEGDAEAAEEATANAIDGVPYVAAPDAVRSLTIPEYLIPGILERMALAELFGGWGSGKSAVMLDMYCRLAHGMPIHGRPTEPTLVVILAGEGQRGFMRRIAAWCKAHGVEPPANLVVIPQALPLGDREGEAALMATLARIAEDYGQDIGAVVVDTLARNFGSGDENSNADMGGFVASLGRVIHRFRCAVMALHHPGHNNKDRARGGSALAGALDLDLRLEALGAGRVLVTCVKAKDMDSAIRLDYALEGYPLEIEGETVWTVVAKEVQVDAIVSPELAEQQVRPMDREVLRVLRQAMHAARDRLERAGRNPGEAYIDARGWRELCEDEGVLKAAAKRQQFNGCRARLAAAGLVLEAGGGWAPLTTSSIDTDTDDAF